MERLIDEATTAFLKDTFDKSLKRDVDIKVYSAQTGQYAEFTAEFLRELALISDKIKINIFSAEEGKKKGFPIDPYIVFGEDLGYKIYFSGTPAGHEANTLIETIKMISTGEAGLSAESLEAVKKLDKPVKLQTFVTTSCPYCPQAAALANRFAVARNDLVSSEVIEAEENLSLSQDLDISSVPILMVNEVKESRMLGVQPEPKLLTEVLRYGSGAFEEYLKQKEKEKAEAMVLEDNPDSVILLGESNFKEALLKYPRLVVDSWAEWCAPCRMMSPVIEELAKEYAGRVVYGKLNVDENPVISSEYKITSIPTLLIFKDGSLAGTMQGAQTKQVVEEEVSSLLKLLIV